MLFQLQWYRLLMLLDHPSCCILELGFRVLTERPSWDICLTLHLGFPFFFLIQFNFSLESNHWHVSYVKKIAEINFIYCYIYKMHVYFHVYVYYIYIHIHVYAYGYGYACIRAHTHMIIITIAIQPCPACSGSALFIFIFQAFLFRASFDAHQAHRL